MLKNKKITTIRPDIQELESLIVNSYLLIGCWGATLISFIMLGLLAYLLLIK